LVVDVGFVAVVDDLAAVCFVHELQFHNVPHDQRDCYHENVYTVVEPAVFDGAARLGPPAFVGELETRTQPTVLVPDRYFVQCKVRIHEPEDEHFREETSFVGRFLLVVFPVGGGAVDEFVDLVQNFDLATDQESHPEQCELESQCSVGGVAHN